MRLEELLGRCDAHRRRWQLVGTAAAGVLAVLDLEGRLYAVLGGEVLNRVNPLALAGISSRAGYLNPGGDGLWPAPEGSRLGYEYATGGWRVPPGLAGARYWVTAATAAAATIRAEVDLINAVGLGVPAAFERQVAVAAVPGGLAMTVAERLEYLGDRPRSRAECLLVPWTLAQFDCGPGCEVVFPAVPGGEPWDLYDPSDACRRRAGGQWHSRTEGGGKRYQLGLGPEVEWLEYRDPRRGLTVRRSAEPLPPGQEHIDLADRPPDQPPDGRGIRYSVYSDPSGFMEIEAAGGAPAVLEPGAVAAVTVRTEYRLAGGPPP